jgi:tetratricopeptide (TPR) repeat protein
MTKGRAGWIGFFAGLIYVITRYGNNYTVRNKWVLRGAVLGVLLVIGLTHFYKRNSSNGRLLIYKISSRMFNDHPLFGAGNGQFKNIYNEYQADYFVGCGIDTDEALLADNTFYAFNDYWQVILENGITGLVLAGIFISIFVSRITRINVSGEGKVLLVAAVSSLLCLAVAAWFSYPLQNPAVLIQCTFCLAIINSFPVKHEKLYILPVSQVISRTTGLLLSVFLFYLEYLFINYKSKVNAAFTLSVKGYREEALKKYRQAADSYFADGNSLYSYAQELYFSGNLTPALYFLKRVRYFFADNRYYSLRARIYNELGYDRQAEWDFKKSIYMVPNRMSSRRDIMRFYFDRHDTLQTVHWAKSILRMPVKVPSRVTARIRQEARDILHMLIKKRPGN